MNVIFLTGCFDSVEINNRSVILEFAIDKNDKNDKKEKPYEITYSIPDMAKLSGTESLALDMKTNIPIQAKTIVDSLDILETKTRNTITFSHVKVIFLGEDLLKDDKLFKQTLDSMTRGRQFARNIPILAVNGRTEEAISIKNTQQPIIGLYIMNYFNNKERPLAYFEPQLLGNFIRDMQDTGVALMPIFKLPKSEDFVQSKEPTEIEKSNNEINLKASTENEQMEVGNTSFEISGAALLKNYTFVEYLDKNVVRGKLLIDGHARDVPVITNYKDSPITYVLEHTVSSIDFKTINGNFCTVINIAAKGEIAEYTDNNIFNQTAFKEIKLLIADEIYRQTKITLDKAKELNIDFLKIGDKMFRKEPNLWKDYKDTWEQNGFEEMPIYVNINVDINNTGILM
ncbi:hypothetical protein AN641_03420 [Candidatus Epulonipiscioides gigas]|nr:hypothetical protein AN641_03420 [Epulopiscium sp. SCG-C07WGA-EpuloA2]